MNRKEGGKVFGAGSRNTVAIFIGVKDPSHTGPCEVRYRDIGDYLTREDKLRTIADGTLTTVDWQPITPNAHGDWITQRSDKFGTWRAIGGKAVGAVVFAAHSGGLKTNRDAWCYNFSRATVGLNMRRTINFYNAQCDGFMDYCERHGIRDRKQHVNAFIDADPKSDRAE
ncbi:type ISP restriction/modification enzyme [Pseudonocardia nigra]|uniref:type ISP restriction/modification enzyme n=1 Tax=Pseudonocardia nigra TaxID=1921578 RepID=UPI001C5D62FB|nr:type ISP restriction/modification enzyme [Pseudonocardia nigra]